MMELSVSIQSQLSMVSSLFLDAVILLIVFLFWKFFCKKGISELGFEKKHALWEYLAGLVVGLVLFTGAYALCVMSRAAEFMGFSSEKDKWLLVLFFLGYIVQGAAEEVLCRGFIMRYLSESGSTVVAILVNSILFSVIHITNSGVSALALVNLFLFGVMTSLYCLRRGNLWGVCAFHTMWNFTQGNVFGISVSGNEKAVSVFASEVSESGSLLNGGAFGLEGGLCVTLVMVLAVGILLFVGRRDHFAVYK